MREELEEIFLNYTECQEENQNHTELIQALEEENKEMQEQLNEQPLISTTNGGAVLLASSLGVCFALGWAAHLFKLRFLRRSSVPTTQDYMPTGEVISTNPCSMFSPPTNVVQTDGGNINTHPGSP